jgi:hypothetical protein
VVEWETLYHNFPDTSSRFFCELLAGSGKPVRHKIEELVTGRAIEAQGIASCVRPGTVIEETFPEQRGHPGIWVLSHCYEKTAEESFKVRHPYYLPLTTKMP